MHALSASDILWVWEVGQQKQSTDKALLLLSLAWPSLSPAELNSLTIGQRNAHLLLLRKETLGPLANCFARCPFCGEQLEFTLDTQTMLSFDVPAPGEIPEPRYAMDVGAYHLSFRVPTCADLSVARQATDRQNGRSLLLERCVIQSLQGRQTIAVTDLPAEVLQALSGMIIELDPLADTELTLNCPACQKNWTLYFDIASFFWEELNAQAKRLLYDVHAIASAYGWREKDILALSSARRRFYLELIR